MYHKYINVLDVELREKISHPFYSNIYGNVYIVLFDSPTHVFYHYPKPLLPVPAALGVSQIPNMPNAAEISDQRLESYNCKDTNVYKSSTCT